MAVQWTFVSVDGGATDQVTIVDGSDLDRVMVVSSSVTAERRASPGILACTSPF